MPSGIFDDDDDDLEIKGTGAEDDIPDEVPLDALDDVTDDWLEEDANKDTDGHFVKEMGKNWLSLRSTAN